MPAAPDTGGNDAQTSFEDAGPTADARAAGLDASAGQEDASAPELPDAGAVARVEITRATALEACTDARCVAYDYNLTFWMENLTDAPLGVQRSCVCHVWDGSDIVYNAPSTPGELEARTITIQPGKIGDGWKFSTDSNGCKTLEVRVMVMDGAAETVTAPVQIVLP